jgi:multimeric flavodoxin WrbA
MPSQPERPAGHAGGACALVLAASPHREGAAVMAARALVRGMQAAGRPAELLDLSLLAFEGCRHCGACARAPHACARAIFDDCEAVFARLAGAPFIAFAVPIYNYGLPAQFKALVDRTQRFYEAGVRPLAGVPACAVFLAGRTAGRRLFEGAGLELGCFCRTMGLDLRNVKELRGVERPPEAGGLVLAEIEALGRTLAAGLVTPRAG